MKVEVFVGLSSVRSDLVEGERSTAEIGWCYSYLLSIKTYETRDQHMLRRLWVGCALGGLGHVTAHDLKNSENTKLEALSTYILLQFHRNMLNIHIIQTT